MTKLISGSLIGIAMLLSGRPVSLGAEPDVAEVPASLHSSQAYAEYARILVQLDLLSNPAIAYLPITVSQVEPGTLSLGGMVANNKVRNYVVDSARRISGLAVRDVMQIGQVDNDYFVKVPADRLESLTSETLSALFPEINAEVRTTVTEEGVVVLNGTVPSYEAKLSLSQAVKSQPGCKAVVNLLLVAANQETGSIAVSEDGQLTLNANELPAIPAAPLVDFEKNSEQPTVRALTTRVMADDAAESDPFTKQVEEDVRIKLQRSPQLAGVDFEVLVNGSEVIITAKLDSREEVEEIVAIASEVGGITKVVARCSPYSIQRNVPLSAGANGAEMAEKEPKKKLFGFVPLLDPRGKGGDKSLATDRRFRETVRKTLKKRCDDRLDDLVVREHHEVIQIEGEVETARDRTFVLKQVDNIVELRGVSYEVALRVKEK